MSAPGAGILLALSGDDAEILWALSQTGNGLCVMHRCANLPELLLAGVARLAEFVLLDTGSNEIDRTIPNRFTHVGLSGMPPAEAHGEERWRSTGWPILRRDTEPGRICVVSQDLMRHGGASGAAPTGNGLTADSADWLSAATPTSTEPSTEPHTESNTAVQEIAWLGELWRQSLGPPESKTAPSQPSWVPDDAGVEEDTGQNQLHGREPAVADTSEPMFLVAASPASDERGGRVVLVWESHSTSGRSTVAASLAYGLAVYGGAVPVDADVRAPSLVQLLGMPENSSALAGATRLATHDRFNMESSRRVLVPTGDGLFLLDSLDRPGRWRELPPVSMAKIWAQRRRAAAWTVIDVADRLAGDDVDDLTPEPGCGAVTADLMPHADVILVVGGADPVGVRRLFQLLDEAGAPMSSAGRVEVIINRARVSAVGPSPQQALRKALARFGGLEDIVLLSDDAATADTCLP